MVVECRKNKKELWIQVRGSHIAWRVSLDTDLAPYFRIVGLMEISLPQAFVKE